MHSFARQYPASVGSLVGNALSQSVELFSCRFTAFDTQVVLIRFRFNKNQTPDLTANKSVLVDPMKSRLGCVLSLVTFRNERTTLLMFANSPVGRVFFSFNRMANCRESKLHTPIRTKLKKSRNFSQTSSMSCCSTALFRN